MIEIYLLAIISLQSIIVSLLFDCKEERCVILQQLFLFQIEDVRLVVISVHTNCRFALRKVVDHRPLRMACHIRRVLSLAHVIEQIHCSVLCEAIIVLCEHKVHYIITSFAVLRLYGSFCRTYH